MGYCRGNFQPHHIFFNPDDFTVKLSGSDFTHDISQTQKVVPTVFSPYLSPELVYSKEGCVPSPEVDVWGIGCTLAQFLMGGVPPFSKASMSNADYLKMLIETVGIWLSYYSFFCR